MENIEGKDLLIKYLLGETSLEETSFVLNWIHSSDQNKNDFLELQALVDSILASSNPYKINSEQAYRDLQKKLENKKTETKPLKNQLFSFVRIAAIFILGFVISWMVHYLIGQPALSNHSMSYQKIYVPYGSKTRLELPDGSRVILNSGSSLKYPVQFGDKIRDVYLDGEAYFEVKKDKKKPFFVNTAGIHIKVLGTSFNVKAYPEEKTVETTLVTGSIQIFSDKRPESSNKPVCLVPKQKAIYIRNTREDHQNNRDSKSTDVVEDKTEPIQVRSEVKTELCTAWKDNRLEFDNELFHDVIVKIERWYNVEIELNNFELNNARFSGKFDKENIEQAMKALVVVTPFRYEINKNKIKIY
jgi:transmembrane sensor